MTDELNDSTYRDSTTCKCGARKMAGSRSCRACFVGGRGVKPGRRQGRSLEMLVREANEKLRDAVVGESVTIDGYTFTKT